MAPEAKKFPDAYHIRPAETRDLKKVLTLSNKVSLHYQGVRDITYDRLKNEWETPGFDLQKSTRLVFSPQGNLVGEVEVWDLSQPPIHPWVWMVVDPECSEAHSVRAQLLEWGEERSREALPRVEPDIRASMRVSIYHENQDAADLLKAQGFQFIRHFFTMRIEMEEPPPEPEWREGITLRPYDPERDSETVYRVDDEVFQDHFGYVEEPFEEGYKRFMHHMTDPETYDPDLWFLAAEDDEIVGICICRKWSQEDRDAGHISSLGVRRPWRRQGIALALLRHAFGEFYRRGKTKVDLGVDAENLTGAMRLYREAGMVVHHQYDLYEKELRPGKEISVTSLGSS
jgi:ribosomal protein S18 acetylase RimI-like enzyme